MNVYMYICIYIFMCAEINKLLSIWIEWLSLILNNIYVGIENIYNMYGERIIFKILENANTITNLSVTYHKNLGKKFASFNENFFVNYLKNV